MSFRKVQAGQVLHHQVEDAVFLPGIVGPNDIGMIHLPDHFHFAAKAVQQLGSIVRPDTQRLDGDETLQIDVISLENGSHAPLADDAQNLIAFMNCGTAILIGTPTSRRRG